MDLESLLLITSAEKFSDSEILNLVCYSTVYTVLYLAVWTMVSCHKSHLLLATKSEMVEQFSNMRTLFSGHAKAANLTCAGYIAS